MVTDIQLSNKQLKQLSLAITIEDVLECIKKDTDSYLIFLKEEFENEEITEEEYKKELILVDTIKSKKG